jgi:hypothetical protein
MTPTTQEAAGAFADLGLGPELLAALTGLGYEEPTRSSGRPCRCSWPAGTCSARPPPAPARPRRSPCPCFSA